MGLAALSQPERLELPFFNRRYLVHWELTGKTLYISDRSFKYDYGAGEQDYEDYLFDLSELTTQLSRIGPNVNTSFPLRFKNQKIGSYDYLIELDSAYRFTFSTIKIYEVRYVADDETFSSDIKTLVFRGVCGQPYNVSRQEFSIDSHNVLLAKRGRLPLDVIDQATFPSADPDDLGAMRNSVYGDIQNVVCRSVVAGALDFLDVDIDPEQTTISVSGQSKITYPSSGTIQIDEEQITYTGFSSNQFTGCTRGANSSTAHLHDKGSAVFEVLTEYIYEVACHAVKSIGDVYVDGVLIDSSDYTAYTGQVGDQKSGYGASAVIVFTVQPIIRKQVALVAEVDEGIHGHTSDTSSTETRLPTGTSGSNCFSPANAIDGNIGTSARCTAGGYELCKVSFAGGARSNVKQRQVQLTYRTGYSTPYEAKYRVYMFGAAIQYLSVTGGDLVTVILTFEANNDDCTVYIDKTSNYDSLYVHEVDWVKMEYGTGVVAAPATGIYVEIGGNTSAETVIGRQVTVDVQGYQDDGSGTITGVANSLIERPDHVFEHILTELLGESSTDIGATFATSGASYGTTYKFAFVLHEIAVEADQLTQQLAFQARSKFIEWGGKFELIYIKDEVPSEIKDYGDDESLLEPIFNYTPEIEIKNKIFALYKRDYRKGGQGAYDGVETESDPQSISDYGERPTSIQLSACRFQTMAANWAGWYLGQVSREQKIVKVSVPWIGKALQPWHAFRLTWDFFDGSLWDLIEAQYDKVLEQIHLTGRIIGDKVSADLVIKYDSIGRILSDFQFVYDSSGRVQVDSEFVFDSSGRVQVDPVFRFDVGIDLAVTFKDSGAVLWADTSAVTFT